MERFVKTKQRLTQDIIKEIHKTIITKINDKEAGEYRKVNVRILGAVKSPPQYSKIPKLMSDRIDKLNKEGEFKIQRIVPTF